MTETPTIPPFVNKAMKFVLRSPAHGMVSKTILLISFTGRKSGKTFTTPVSYSQYGDQVRIFTHANWWKNLLPGAVTGTTAATPVTLRLRGREIQGLAEPVVEDKHSIAIALVEHLQKVPGDARYYEVTFDNHGHPRMEEVQRAAQTVVMIRISLC